MKRTLGIFGDSFAAQDGGVPLINYKSWPELLSEEFDVTNYAASNSCLYYSVSNFLNNHFKYDYVVFHVTGYGRLYLEEKNSIITADGRKIRHVKANQRSMLKPEDLKSSRNLTIIQAIENYYAFVFNAEKEIYCHNLMIADIKSKRPDILILDLWGWCDKENDFYSYYHGKTKIDYRKNHLTKTNHVMLFQYIKDSIDGNHPDIDQYYRTPEEPYEYYFTDE